MKTPVEMQLKIIDKMRENVEKGSHIYTDIQVKGIGALSGWLNKGNHFLDFSKYQHRIKPQTIKVIGVDIKKPMSFNELDEMKNSKKKVFYPCLTASLYVEVSVLSALYDMNENTVCYKTKEEAIEASKLLFGLKD